MAKQTRVFYAYPSNPPTVGEVINGAIADLRIDPEIHRNNIRFSPWPDVRVSGKQLVATILRRIDRSQIFACDMTYPNPNVSFELGYAAARFKRIFASLDTSIEAGARRYRRLYSTLLRMGYSEYHNHPDLVAAFKREGPWKNLEATLLAKRYQRQFSRPESPTLFYVKPAISSESVIATEEAIRNSIFGPSLLVDDSRDNPSASLEWYADQLLSADAIVIQMLGTEQAGHFDHNIRASVVAGLALGLRRPIVMLAQAPYDPPMDYENLLNVHDTASTCVQFVSQRLAEIEKNLPRRRSRRPRTEGKAPVDLDIRSLSLGQHVAELERFDLDEYFVETSAFYRTLEGPTTILIGRRGSGKTAILYGIQAELARNRNNGLGPKRRRWRKLAERDCL